MNREQLQSDINELKGSVQRVERLALSPEQCIPIVTKGLRSDIDELKAKLVRIERVVTSPGCCYPGLPQRVAELNESADHISNMVAKLGA